MSVPSFCILWWCPNMYLRKASCSQFTVYCCQQKKFSRTNVQDQKFAGPKRYSRWFLFYASTVQDQKKCGTKKHNSLQSIFQDQTMVGPKNIQGGLYCMFWSKIVQDPKICGTKRHNSLQSIFQDQTMVGPKNIQGGFYCMFWSIIVQDQKYLRDQKTQYPTKYISRPNDGGT